MPMADLGSLAAIYLDALPNYELSILATEPGDKSADLFRSACPANWDGLQTPLPPLVTRISVYTVVASGVGGPRAYTVHPDTVGSRLLGRYGSKCVQGAAGSGIGTVVGRRQLRFHRRDVDDAAALFLPLHNLKRSAGTQKCSR